MLEVNDFSAIRISLASPEQVRGWSYGEVTKPETINYRTLKPEKDGLFCEKIFGPTKDFECYCGKYKRIRYKGIVCDKCGVEVARSKVRRERMGHIDLAAPVAHIWFAKGAPSRLGLLLDLSPRNLEQVLYFAKLIVTEVNQEALDQARQEARDREMAELRHLEVVFQEKLTELQQRESATSPRGAGPQDGLLAQAQALEETIQANLRKKAREDFLLGETVIVVKGSIFSQKHLAALQRAVSPKGRASSTAKAKGKRKDQDLAQAQQELEENQASQDEQQLLRQLAQEKEKVQAAARVVQEELDELQPQALLAEPRYRELKLRWGQFFRASIGAEAILDILAKLNLDDLKLTLQKEVNSGSGQRRKKATKRLRVAEAFRKSGNRPEWMILTVLPVLPPDLRPMVQLDGGRFATSDLNDLYRRVINRNNRLRRLLELGAPEIIVRNEKRMLQEAVDSLIDNGRRGRAVTTGNSHRLKSLSDMLRGKQGRFRQNLLGKRVDYSGRSVIVVGPELKLNQCGLPKRMALELFKPFVMHRLVARGLAHNIKSAKRIVERVKPEVWDILEEVIKTRPVFLNRAPTLHRLGIQAFEPILIEGSAIQIHPLVCTAFNADFDGDQMAVHVPLSAAAVQEAREVMMSTFNMLSPSSGEPLVAPTLDMVLGCYYLTTAREGAKGEGMRFASLNEARLAYDLGHVSLQALIKVRQKAHGPMLETTVGRILFNEILPEGFDFFNETMDKKLLKQVVGECHHRLGNEAAVKLVDAIKDLGFHHATKSGITISLHDIEVPEAKGKLLAEAEERMAETVRQYRRGLITEEERYNSAVTIWTEATDKMTLLLQESMDKYGSISMMATSGAKGNIAQIRQMAGMRGLMTDPSGRIIDMPIRSSFKEGLTVLEYFISTHGARKGLADTALRTADSGYLTRRLIDVSQDVIITEEDCGTTVPAYLSEPEEKGLLPPLLETLVGRLAGAQIRHPQTGEVLAERNDEIDVESARSIIAAGIDRVPVRSLLSCQSRRGVCRRCYGWSPARGALVAMGEAVGIIAAQSIGEPGTQLTMRTFHTGGVVGLDITSGLPRVEELFEARTPKGKAEISEIDGVAELLRSDEGRRLRVSSTEIYHDDYPIPPGYKLEVADDQKIEAGLPLAAPLKEEAPAPKGTLAPEPILARVGGIVKVEDGRVSVWYEETEVREYPVMASARLQVSPGGVVKAGDSLTGGPRNPQDILRIMGREAVQNYLVTEVQKVYRSQGVSINNKHIETVVRQMLRKVRVESSGDTGLLPGELVERFRYEEINAKVLAEGGEPATAQAVLLGVTKASLNTDSFLAAASFQETTRILTEAAVSGSTDRLSGLKENVIIGKLIPARSIVVEKPAPDQFALPEFALLGMRPFGEEDAHTINPMQEADSPPVTP
ncbi:MAG: DNA-directed RNA polymerase subunit beta' [Chloroflexi bacterium]|nr:DNA-directed RNA polymerase subunit beta' [Chloroflexota bacterium]